MNIKIIQPAGLGDILFCLKIAQTYINQGNLIYWPVVPQYYWIKNYIEIEGLKWEDISNPDYILNLQIAGRIFPNTPIMDAKYKMANMSYDNWQDYLVFKRNPEKENNLYKALIKKEPFCLINEMYATPPILNIIIDKSDISNIYISLYDSITPFDWCKIIEDASELRLVDTCFTYIIEKLNLKAEKICLYAREEGGIFHTKHLWTKPWKYIE